VVKLVVPLHFQDVPQVGPSGTPSALLPLAYMPFNKASMTVEFRPGVTVFRDGTGHSATVCACGVHAREDRTVAAG
jgi:hypothetical protein